MERKWSFLFSVKYLPIFFFSFSTVRILFQSPTDQMPLNVFRFLVRVRTYSPTRTAPRLAVGAHLVLSLRLVMVSSFHTSIRSGMTNANLFARRSGVVNCTLLLDVAQLALDRRERNRPGSVGADTVGPGYAGCLEIVDQVLAWREG
jgi:hypothetical protein